MIDFNASQAYIRAGYSKNGAKVSACKLLTNTNLQFFLAGLIKKQEVKNEITVSEIIQKLKIIVNRCMQKIQVFNKKGEPTGEWKFDSAGANRSLELLGRHLGMFTDKFKIVDENLHITVTLQNAGDAKSPMKGNQQVSTL